MRKAPMQYGQLRSREALHLLDSGRRTGCVPQGVTSSPQLAMMYFYNERLACMLQCNIVQAHWKPARSLAVYSVRGT